MLFSMYASYRWAKGRDYIPKTAILIMILSILSTVLALGYLIFFSGPLPFLSFPFIEVWNENRIKLSPPFQYSNWLDSYEITFFATPIFQLVPQGPVVGGMSPLGMVEVTSYRVILLNAEIGGIDSGFLLVVLLLFFVMVNALGALIGFLLSKIESIEKIKWGSKGLWIRIAFGIVVLAFGIWLSTIGEVAQASPSSSYYVSYNTYPYATAAFASIWFAISWIVAIIIEYQLEKQV